MASTSTRTISKEQVYKFMQVYDKKPVSVIISSFLEMYPNFSKGNGLSLHQRLTRVYQCVKKYKKDINKGKNRELLSSFFAEEFTVEPDGTKTKLCDYVNAADKTEESDLKNRTDFDQMKEINLQLMEYIRTLEHENSELREALSEDVAKVEDTMRQYNEALHAMKNLSDEAEENYDKILTLRTVNGKESKSDLEQKLKEIEEKYKNQCAMLKEKEDLVKYYYDENVRKREATAKKTKKPEKVKNLKSNEKSLTTQVEKLMDEHENLMQNVVQQNEQINALLLNNRKLDEKCSSLKEKATDTKGK